MNETIVKKTKAEKALFKVHRNNHNDSKRNMYPSYTKRKGMLGLKCRSIQELGAMLKVADALELELMK